MTRVHDRPRVREHDDAVAERLLREVFPETGPQRGPPTEPPADIKTGRPIRWMRWLGATAAVIILAVVAAIIISGNDNPAPTEPATVSEVTEVHTADWWERHLTPAPAPRESYTADRFERELTPEPAVSEFHTADWWERYFTSLNDG